MKNWKGSGHGQDQDTMPSGTKEHRKKSVRIGSAMVKIQIRHLLNASQKFFHLDQLPQSSGVLCFCMWFVSLWAWLSCWLFMKNVDMRNVSVFPVNSRGFVVRYQSISLFLYINGIQVTEICICKNFGSRSGRLSTVFVHADLKCISGIEIDSNSVIMILSFKEESTWRVNIVFILA